MIHRWMAVGLAVETDCTGGGVHLNLVRTPDAVRAARWLLGPPMSFGVWSVVRHNRVGSFVRWKGPSLELGGNLMATEALDGLCAVECGLEGSLRVVNSMGPVFSYCSLNTYSSEKNNPTLQ